MIVRSINYYLTLANDKYRPKSPKPSLQQYCPYQNYTIFCLDRTSESNKTEYYQTNVNGLIATFNVTTHTANLIEHIPPKQTTEVSESIKGSWLAIQSFSTEPIPINFLDYVRDYHG
jgi:hypothetical protein